MRSLNLFYQLHWEAFEAFKHRSGVVRCVFSLKNVTDAGSEWNMRESEGNEQIRGITIMICTEGMEDCAGR